jgi:hypothetical protein
MGEHRKRTWWAVPLALAVLATACGSDDDDGAEAIPTTAGGATGAAAEATADSLEGICPGTIVVQTDWFPEAEHGALYQLMGDDPSIDASQKVVKGPLVAPGGGDTGVDIEVRTGGPAIGFQQVVSLLRADPEILLGYVATGEAIENYADVPTRAIVAPLEIDPQIIMWDPRTYPDVQTIADLGRRDVPIRYFATGAYMKYLVSSGQVKQGQLDASYDGSPAVFTAQGGKVAQQGFASAEPYTYEKLIPEWNRPVDFQLVHDAGWTGYAAPLAVTHDKFDRYKDCFAKLVPMVQQAQVDFVSDPDETNALIVKAVTEFRDFWVYSPDLAEFSVRQQVDLGLVGNGPDDTLGNFDEARITDFIKKALPVYTANNPPADLQVSDLVTNEFIDPSIGLD